MNSNVIDILQSGKSSAVLDTLYDLCASDSPARIDDDELTYRLLRSRDPLVRERAIFLFGIKLKEARLCDEFVRQLSGENLDDSAIISALMLSIMSTGCPIDLPSLRGALQRVLDNPEIMRQIGMVVVGFARLAAGDLDRSAFKPYLVAEGQPDDAEVNAVRRLLA